jgi:hypothetical protein
VIGIHLGGGHANVLVLGIAEFLERVTGNRPIGGVEVLEEERESLLLAGMNYFLPKPIIKPQLDQALDTLFDHAIAWYEAASA